LNSVVISKRSLGRIKDYVLLTKPVVVLLLLVTTFTGMVVAGDKLPTSALIVWTLLGGALAAGGSHALNQYVDRDLDRQMARTANRPVATGRLYPRQALILGLVLCGMALSILTAFVNEISALLALAGIIFYVLVYSLFLKKATIYNIVIGGAAGAIPPLVGWSAVTGSLDLDAFFLFAVVFMWTPPHFWSLALVRKNEYAAAGVPMLPVIRGDKATHNQILVYSLGLVALSLLAPLVCSADYFYLAVATCAGASLISRAWSLLKWGKVHAARKMYLYSSLYLGVLFLALMVDVMI
jgi:protoheme IX farnesyltransferase